FQPVMAAAESVESTDSKVWTIKLKDGWTFHNGEKVTSDSYIAAWNYGAYGPNGQGNNEFFEKFEGFEALNPKDKNAAPATKTLSGLKKVDDLTFEADLKEPFSAFREMLGYTAFYPIPKAAEADMKAFEEAPIGNGPFQLDGKWEHDKSVKVKVFDAYKGAKKPKIKGIEFRIYQQPSAMYADLVSGNLDVMTAIPTESLKSAKSDLGDRFKLSPNSAIYFLGYPTYDPQFEKPEVRMALSMAVDRKEIVEKIFANTRVPADSFVSPIIPGYAPGSGGDAVKFDPAKAKQILEAAGGLLGGTLTITYNTDGGHKEWIEAICNQLSKNLGIKCTATPEPKFADLLKKAQAKEKIGLIRMGWVADYYNKTNYFGPLYSANGSSNYYGYNNPAFDALLAEGDRSATSEEALKKYAEAEAILAKDVPVMPLFYGQNVFGHSSKVQNVFVETSTHVDLFQIDSK
ncbi:MAG: ABC transporter substrate-binding protein, partial [Longispora sp.]|nr:ABC transporter substrate-binding protein [Longispora sp. (in: high G+C Gram-positive bacteria)]